MTLHQSRAVCLRAAFPGPKRFLVFLPRESAGDQSQACGILREGAALLADTPRAASIHSPMVATSEGISREFASDACKGRFDAKGKKIAVNARRPPCRSFLVPGPKG